jgi:hypothetical protein
MAVGFRPRLIQTEKYCVQPFTVKQPCVLNECIPNHDNFSMVGIGFLYKSKSTGKRANHWRDKECILTSSVSAKFRNVVQENRVGVSQDKMFEVDNSSC